MAAEQPAIEPASREDGSVSSPTSPAAIKSSTNPEEEIRAVARKFSEQSLQNPESGVWGVLTAISRNARNRFQGMNILLSGEEHCLGRCVEDSRFQIAAIAVSASHCKIFRGRDATGDEELNPRTSVPVFLKDTSTNGTYLNWTKLRKGCPKARLRHGDIISFVAPPHDDKAYAFVYREVHVPSSVTNGFSLKRNSDDLVANNKRLKGIGIGAPEGPVSLDDVRSLQRSNTDLRQQLESHLLSIETLHKENREAAARHVNELKELKETVANSYHDQVKDLRKKLEAKQQELDELNTVSSELKNCIKELNERLTASMQSRHDADEIINSQKATITELEAQVDEERNQRRDDREKAAADLKSALQKVHLEAQEEIKRQADCYLRQQKEQTEYIIKLQESEKENRLLLETLRSKLENARESLVVSEKKVRQLEVQFNEEHLVSANSKKKIEKLESELQRLEKELEREKVAREEAWSKVSALELEIAAAIRDLSIEKQRFEGARERIILRETQLRAFYSTTEEISALFTKQQEQLKAMQRTLEDEENYETASFKLDLNELSTRNINTNGRELPRSGCHEASGCSTPKNDEDANSVSGNDASETQKHDCDMQSQDGNTQDLEFTSADRPVGGFGSDIEGVCTAVMPDLNDTEQVLGTESPVIDAYLNRQNFCLQKCSNMAEDTMQLDDELQVEHELEKQMNKLGDTPKVEHSMTLDDTETGTIRTSDLLASEPVGSWAISTAPSVHGENESPASMFDDADADVPIRCSEGHVSGSQTNAASALPKLTKEHRALRTMIEIVEPDFKQQLQSGGGFDHGGNASMSDTETQDGGNDSNNSDGTDREDPGGEGKDNTENEGEEDGNEVTIEDSVG